MHWAAPSSLLGAIVSFAFLVPAASQAATPDCEPVVAEIVSVEGSVRLQRADTAWQDIGLGTELCDKDTVRTEANSRAAIALVNDAIFRIDQNTAVHLADIAPEREEKSFVELLVGAIQSFSRQPREIAVDTPYLNATIEGTEFVIRVAENEARLTVFEGAVLAANPQGEAVVGSGEAVVAQAGHAPEKRILVRPRDAAQWAIYYPPVLAAMGGAEPPAGLPPTLAEAIALAARNDAAGALQSMDSVPPAQRDGQWSLYRASILLSAGQPEEARLAIASALQAEPDQGLAYALRAIIDVARNRPGEALANAERAVDLAPDSAAARIAHSYALQANFRLGDARQTLERAIAANPDDALAHARLAELWMMIGYRNRAREEAQRAVQLAPDLERAHVVRGFAALVEIRTGPAKRAFRRAITLDSDDPLPHLGLGLALIREGDLAEGRRQIEVAVGLAPEDALLRSYLGKAYYEEKRNDLSGQQLEIGKELDPKDPTPHLYDAIRLRSENRPVEALRDLQTSVELNDNRAVYRGRLQLDEDRAARGASLAQIYKDLGFDQLGVNESAKSLALAPDSAAAHRFLSDSLVGFRSREISRVSEQLQARMLQDININPVQPSLSETNLNVFASGGPANAGFNEFTPLFERNRAQLNATGEYGTQDSWGAEGVVSGVYNWLSLSAGVYHFETDGWRENDDIQQDTQNVYGQVAITPTLNLQAEYRRNETETGDIAFNFSSDPSLPTLREDITREVSRGGIRWSPAPHSDILLSYINSSREQDTFFSIFIPVPVPTLQEITIDAESDGDQFEGQYIFRQERYNLVAGGLSTTIDNESTLDILENGAPVGFPFPITDISETEDKRGYAYLNVNWPDPVIWTFGVNYVDFEDRLLAVNEVEEVDPKVGVQWNILPDLLFRAAYIETVKPPLVANRTLEPTQVAGFNQFFDDANGTETKYYGVGLDWQAVPPLALGVEATKREIADPYADTTVFPPAIVIDDAEEEVYRAYAYWTPSDALAVRASVAYDHWERESDAFTAASLADLPLDVRTVTAPLSATYFHPSGFFAGVGYTYVDQEVTRLPFFPNQGEEQFSTVDLGVGYRFPRRAGIASLQVRNLFDEEFVYQDDNFRVRTDDPLIAPFVPERTILGRVTLNF